ncbi:LptF/LptG family permease [candidate division KSB1 bacterium]|nr:LptF/LptG family permease [candidate division KSB1 bacterium]
MLLFFLILEKYVLRRHVGPFFFGLFVITLLFLLNLAFRELGRILSKGLELMVILEFFALNLAWIIALAVPMAVLTAALMAFGSLSADNEITAFKASGVSLYRIISAVVIVAVLLSGFLMWFNNAVLPNFNHRARLLGSDISTKHPTLKLEPGVLFQQDRFNIMVRKILSEKKNVSTVADVVIFSHDGIRFNQTIVAETGEILIDEVNERLQLKLFKGELHEIDWDNLVNYRKLNFPQHLITLAIPGLKLTRRQDGYFSDREKSASVMLGDVKKNQNDIQQRLKRVNEIMTETIAAHLHLDRSQRVSLENFQFSPKNFPAAQNRNVPHLMRTPREQTPLPSSPSPSDASIIRRMISEYRNLLYQVRSERSIIKEYERNNYILLVEVHKKYSIPIACIVFVLVGAPLGILARRGNMAASAGIGLFFFLLYWAFLIAGEELADRQIISPVVAMWSPNVLVGIFGIYLVLVVVKEVKLIKVNWLNLINNCSRWLKLKTQANHHENS